jgi:hypothetical protein
MSSDFKFLPRQTINPCLFSLYEWSFSQDPTSLHILIRIHGSPIDPTQLQTSLSDSHTAISVTLPEEVPLLEGTLYSQVRSFNVEFDDEHISLIFAKTGTWPTVISDLHPTTGNADPKSCFELFFAQKSEFLLEKVLKTCYTPALIYAFEAAPERSLGLIRIATDVYNDPIAMLSLGKYLATNAETRDAAFQMFGRAVDGGLILGLSCIGQLISPLSDIPWHHKDPVKAVELFEAVLVKVEDPVAMAELAKLLSQGVGVPKNVERAAELNRRARMKQPELPALHAAEAEAQSPFVLIYRSLSFAAFAGAGAYVAFRIWQARHGAA